MFPNDLSQSHLLTRPASGKILIIAGGKGEELPGAQWDSWAEAMAAAVPCRAVQGEPIPAYPAKGYGSMSPCPVVPATANPAVPGP